MTRALAAAAALLGLLTISCPVMEKPASIPTHGTVWLSAEVAALNYEIGQVHLYSLAGAFIMSASLTPEEDRYIWEMNVEKPEGTPVTAWVEFLDPSTGTVYYGQGQDDVISVGNRIEWTINELYIPLFTEADLKLIGTDERFRADRKFILVADITLTDLWTPLCGDNNPFSGVFDGGNHTISNLRFRTAGVQHFGLFGSARPAQASSTAKVTFKNLKIIIADSQLTFSPHYTQNFGLLVGIAENTEIHRVIISSSATGMANPLYLRADVGAEFNIGGIVGVISGDSRISQCAVQVPLSISVNRAHTAMRLYNGAIAGKASFTSNSTVNGKLELSQSYAPYEIAISLIDTPAEESFEVYAGGILGGAEKCDVAIAESYFAGNISVQNGGSGEVGGIFGGWHGGSAITNSNILCALSVSLASRIDVDFLPSVSAGYSRDVNQITGRTIGAAATLSNYYTTPVVFSGVQPTTTSDLIKPYSRSSVNRAWFGSPLANQGLAWDFNSIWRWSTIHNLPVFSWEK
jgi:hypothetical protein